MMKDEHTSESVHRPVTTAAGVIPVETGPAYLAEPPQTWVVERIDSDGEELPIVRHAATWLPAPIPLRYVVRERHRLGPAQLIADMRAVAILYNWAEVAAGVGDLEAFLTAGRFLSRGQLEDLAAELQRGRKNVLAPDEQQTDCLVAGRTYNVRLFAVRQYLSWAYDHSHYGGSSDIDPKDFNERVREMDDLLKAEAVAVKGSNRREPVGPEEIEIIRRAIGPNEAGEFAPGVFDERTRFRNWVMFETALNFGPRKSELLTLKVEHLARAESAKQIFVPRQQDAPEDPRTRRRPRGKTLERVVRLMKDDADILPRILEYRDADPPVGRGSHPSPYLFLTAAGRPVSNSTADYIIRRIGRYALRALDEDGTLDRATRERCGESLRNLTWHRLRHTWAEDQALYLYDKYDDGAWAILREWGGWKRGESMERYIQHARANVAAHAALERNLARASRSIIHDAAKYSVRAGE